MSEIEAKLRELSSKFPPGKRTVNAFSYGAQSTTPRAKGTSGLGSWRVSSALAAFEQRLREAGK